MCDCRKAVNERLSVSNAKIGEGLMFGDSGVKLAPPMILLEKVAKDKRTRLPTLLATCCPFCGERYEVARS